MPSRRELGRGDRPTRIADSSGLIWILLSFTGTIGQTAGCPTAHRLVYMVRFVSSFPFLYVFDESELIVLFIHPSPFLAPYQQGVAADCAYVIAYGGTENARNAIVSPNIFTLDSHFSFLITDFATSHPSTHQLNNWNTASALYKTTFNISLGIVELFVQEAACPATVDSRVSWNRNCSALGLSDRLSAFSAWRGAERSGDQAGLWALMSGCASGSEVGIAWLG